MQRTASARALLGATVINVVVLYAYEVRAQCFALAHERMCDMLITQQIQCCCLQVFGPEDTAALKSLILSKAGPAGDFGGRYWHSYIAPALLTASFSSIATNTIMFLQSGGRVLQCGSAGAA